MANTRSRRKSKGSQEDEAKTSNLLAANEANEEVKVDSEEGAETVEKISIDRDGADAGDEGGEIGSNDSDSVRETQPPLMRKKKSPAKKIAAHSKEIGNGLTELIPGYTAPLSLDTSSLNSCHVGLSELRERAERTDASTKNFMVPQSGSTVTKTNFLPSNYAAYSFKMGKKRTPDLSAGAGWFKMMSSEVTDEVKSDMALIRNRNYLDPKRFYKKSDKFGKHVQVGTVIEGSAEYYSSRLTKKERRSNLAEEIMADPESSDYAKRKYKKITHERQAAAKHFQKKKRKVTKHTMRGY